MDNQESNTAIDIKRLTKVYRGKKMKKVLALEDLSLSIMKGEVFGFLGPNGAGKSTTIKCLMGLCRPSSGSATICGVSIDSTKARLKVGFLPENPAFYDYLNADEYLSMVGGVFKMEKKQLDKQKEQVLQLVGLDAAKKRQIRSFSKGMVQRLGLAQVLLHDPDVYVLDEPMSGLDPVGRSLVKDIIKDLKVRGKTVFFSTHITSDVESVCDRVAILKGGRLQSVDAVGDLLLQGVEGYRLYLRNDDGQVEEVRLGKEELLERLAKAEQQDEEVVLVEPFRKSLEQFFLDKIKTDRQ